MADICDTVIRFFGDQKALEDLFNKIEPCVLSELAKIFNLKEADFFEKYHDDHPMRGSIIIINKDTHQISQNDGWIPKTAFWNTLIDKNYTRNGKRLIGFVYTAYEPGENIYVNSDIDGKYFDFRFGVDYCIDGKEEHRKFKTKNEAISWCNKTFGLNARSIRTINEDIFPRIKDDIDNYFHAVEYKTSL